MPSKSRLFAVIGPPHCGSSTLTRALPALGISLGDAARSALPANGAGDLFEDADIAALNARLYRALDCEWHRLYAISASDIAALSGTELHDEAVRLIAHKLDASRHDGNGDFGFGNPYMARLLPFWTNVFADLDLPCHYLLTLRHPASMAASLLKLTGFAPAKCQFLWTEYVTAAIAGTRGQALTVVSYDALLDDTSTTLQSIAAQFDLALDPRGETFASFRDDLLQARHSDAGPQRMSASIDAAELYDALLTLGAGGKAASSALFETVNAIHMRHLEAQAVIAAARNEEMRTLDAIRSNLATSRALLELDVARAAEAPSRATLLERSVLERDQLLERASQGLSERNLEVVALRETLNERTVTLHQREADLREHIRALAQAGRGLAERTEELVNTRKLLVERTAALQTASEALIDRTARLEEALAKAAKQES